MLQGPYADSTFTTHAHHLTHTPVTPHPAAASPSLCCQGLSPSLAHYSSPRHHCRCQPQTGPPGSPLQTSSRPAALCCCCCCCFVHCPLWEQAGTGRRRLLLPLLLQPLLRAALAAACCTPHLPVKHRETHKAQAIQAQHTHARRMLGPSSATVQVKWPAAVSTAKE
jgi:hypothetical protein